MKLFLLIISFFFTSQALAHTDHALGEGVGHYLYHLIFFAISLAVVIKAILWYRKKNKQL